VLKDFGVGSWSSWDVRYFPSLVRERSIMPRVLWRFCASRLALPGGMKQKRPHEEDGLPTAQPVYAERAISRKVERLVERRGRGR
jgi:hypothetical protein